MILLLMRADENVVEGQGGAENFVHSIQVAARKISARKLRLVGGGDEHVAGGLEPVQAECGGFVKLEFRQAGG